MNIRSVESLDYPCVNFPVLNFVVDWKLLLLLDCDELCTTLTKMITTTEMNLMIFIFLISICFCCLFCMVSELLIFNNVPVVFQTFKLAVMAKVRGIFFWLLVTVMSICTTLIWVIKTTSLTVFNFFFGKISIRLIRFSLPPFWWV